MKTIRVRTQQRTYAIVVTRDLGRELPRALRALDLGRLAVVVTFPRLKRAFGRKIKRALAAAGKETVVLTVPDTEKSKCAREALRLTARIAAAAKGEDVFLVAVGGGVVGDLAGFVASIYKRGIAVIQVPTTLLAQIDSSIGGKTAVDAPWGKNMLGAFYQPALVVADVGFLKHLPRRQLLAGLSEALKYALIKDAGLFAFYEKNKARILGCETKTLETLVARCAAIKARVVEKDEFDNKDIRIVLNFGHTFAHAFEAASGFRLAHGEAVSLGMACAADTSRTLGLLEKKDHERILALMVRMGLPVRCALPMSWERVRRAIAYDKKHKKGKRRFVLLGGIAKTCIAEDISEDLLKRIIRQRITGIA
ncbi:MAG: 3-dehydroquinate synthase [Deltaproteobacteria bacterium]